MPGVARLGHGVKLPQLGSGAGIIGAGIPRGTQLVFAHAGSHRDHVVENRGDAGVTDHQVHDAVLTEARIELTGIGVERHQATARREAARGDAARGENDARRMLLIARPESHTAPGRVALGQWVAPDFLAGLRFERYHKISRRNVHQSVDHDRRDLRADAFASRDFSSASRVGPGRGQLRNVGRIDLGERGVARAGRIVVIRGPVARRRRWFPSALLLRRTLVDIRRESWRNEVSRRWLSASLGNCLLRSLTESGR
jgi:hypothetical protein